MEGKSKLTRAGKGLPISRGRRWPTREGKAAFAVFAGCLSLAAGQTSQWTGAGSDERWSTPDNWSTAPANPTANAVVFDTLDGGNRSVVDADWTVGSLSYRQIAHTTDLGGNRLQVNGDVAVAAGNLASHTATAIWTNGTLTIGAPGSLQRWLIASNSANVTLAGTQMLAGVTVTGFVSEVNLGYKTTGDGTATGTLSVLEGAKLVLGSAAEPAAIRVAYNTAAHNNARAYAALNAVTGTVAIHASDLYVACRAGNNTGSTVGTLNWNQNTPIDADNVYVGYGAAANGKVLVPPGGVIRLGDESDPVTNLWVGYYPPGANADVEGALAAEAAAVGGAILDLRVGYRTANQGTSRGTVVMGAGTDFTVGGAAGSGLAYVGYNASVNGSTATGRLELVDGRLTLLVSEFSVGRQDNNSGSASGTVILSNAAQLVVGSAAFPGALNVGYNRNSGGQGDASGSILASGDGAALDANLSEWNMGYHTAASGSGADGRLLLAGLSSLNVTATVVRVGVGQAAVGWMELGPGTVRAGVVTNNNGITGGGGSMVLSNTVFQVDTAFTNGSAGTVTSIVAGVSSGLAIANSAGGAFGIHASATIAGGKGLDIVFRSAPTGGGPCDAAGATNVFYAFKWAGNHTNELLALLGTNRINGGTLDGDVLHWDDTTYLASPFSGAMGIFYDPPSGPGLGTDATYIGCYVGAISDVVWSGGGTDDNWSTDGNWQGGVAPANPMLGQVFFSGLDSGNASVVDADWTIGTLVYSNITHTTDLNGGSRLTVDNGLAIGVGDAAASATVVWTNGGAVLGGSGNWRIGEHTGNAAGDVVTGELGLAGVAVTANVTRLSVGCKTTGAGAAVGELHVGGASGLALGAGARLDVGRNDADDADAAGSGLLSVAGALEAAGLSELNVGYQAAASGAATGTLALASAAGLALKASTVRIGVGANAAGTAMLGAQAVTAGVVTVNNGAAGSAGLLRMSGTVFRVEGALNIGANGTVTNWIDQPFGGFLIANPSSAALTSATNATVAAGRGLDLVFLSEPAGLVPVDVAVATGIYYGFKWAGNHTNELKNLLGTDRLNGTLDGDVLRWDDTTHLSAFNGAMSIFYDPPTGAGLKSDATYIGCYAGLANPPTVTWSGAGGDDKWSTALNWVGKRSPANPADATIVFGVLDSGNASVVDADWSVGGLLYSNIAHTTDLNGSRRLAVASNVTVSAGALAQTATATWTNGGHVTIGTPANPGALVVGRNSGVNGTVTGALSLAQVSVTGHLAEVFIGDKLGATPGAGKGRLSVGAGAALALGSSAQPCREINLAQVSQGDNSATAEGIFDATNGSVELHAENLYIARKTINQSGKTLGLLRWNQAAPLMAGNVYVAIGAGSQGLLEAPAGGTLTLGTADQAVSNFWIGTYDAGISAGCSGEVDCVSAALGGYVQDLRVSYRTATAAGGTSYGTLKMGPGSDLTVAGPLAAVGLNQAPNVSAVEGSLTLNAATLTLDVAEAVIGRAAGSGTARGTLDVGAGSELIVGDPARRAALAVGHLASGNGTGDGELRATNGVVQLLVSDFSVGWNEVAASGEASGTVYWNQTTTNRIGNFYLGRGRQGTGRLEVPAGGRFVVGAADDPVSRLWVGAHEVANASTANGTLDAGAAGIGGTVQEFRVGYKSRDNGTAEGAVLLGPTTALTVGRVGNPGLLAVGYSTSANSSTARGSLTLDGGRLTALVSQFHVGHKTANNAAANGAFLMANGAEVALGTAVERAALRVGYNLNPLGAGSATGTFGATNGGSLTGWLSAWDVGVNDPAIVTAQSRTEGTLELGALAALEVNAGWLRVGAGSNAVGVARLGAGTLTVDELTINDGKTNSRGSLETEATQMLVEHTVSLGAYGAATVHVGRAGCGLTLLDHSDDALRVDAQSTIAVGRGLTLIFHPPTGGSGVFYGLKWAGNHVEQLRDLLGADRTNGTLDGDRLRWDDATYLNMPGAVQIFYDGSATYIGYYAMRGAVITVR